HASQVVVRFDGPEREMLANPDVEPATSQHGKTGTRTLELRLTWNVIHRADMRVAECRDRAGFALEALAVFGVAGKVRGQHLDGDGTVEAPVTRAVNLVHAASADGRENFVWS